MRILARLRACAVALALVASPFAASLSGVASAAPTPDLRLDLVWLGSDDAGSGGVLTGKLDATPGDTGTLGVFLTPGPRGLGGYDFDLDFDADLADALDLVGVLTTPPPGWTAGIAAETESDATQAGRIEGLSASGVGGAPVIGDTVQIAALTFRLNEGVDRDAATYITPRIAGFQLDASYEPIAEADVEIGTAGAERQATENEPTFRAPIGAYTFGYDLGSFRVRTAPILPETAPEPTRGVVFQATEDGGFGFLQTGFAVGREFDLRLRFDATKLDTPGAFGGVEFDSPFVPIGVVPQTFFFAGLARQSDGSLSLFANDAGGAVGNPVHVLDDEVELDWAFYQNRLTLRGGPVGGPKQTIVEDHAFPYLGSGGLGLGLGQTLRGDRLGVTWEVSGDLYAAPRRKLLSELDEVVKLEQEAEQLVGQGNLPGAKQKLEEARRRIEQGKLVPGSKPPRYADSLLGQVDAAVPDAKLAAKIKKKLEKAATKDAKAVTDIDGRKSAEQIAKSIQIATKNKLQAKAMLEFLTPKEKPKQA